MTQVAKFQVQQDAGHTQPVAPLGVPDVATQAHPTDDPIVAPSVGNASGGGDEQLQNLLPEINEIAQKVGGYKKLSEIADTLDQMGK
jgi:hypothetical protein